MPQIIDVTPRPSKIDSLKTAVSGGPAIGFAILAALTGLVTAIQSCNSTFDIVRVAYETLKTASEKNAVQIEACRKGQADLQAWVGELSERLERRQVTTEKAITRKVTKPQATPIVPLILEPAPKPPEVPASTQPVPLPPFDALKKSSSV
jgi:hypothetical protein